MELEQNSPATVLLVDDEPSSLESLAKIFSREGYRVLTAADGRAGLDLLRQQTVQVLITDLKMPVMSGADLLKAAKAISPETEVVLMTAFGSVEEAVEAMKQGAYDFVTKPLKRAHIVGVVSRALEKQSLVVENRTLKAKLAAVTQERSLIGSSLPWRRMMEVVMQAAPSSATVLIQGESGTGKELLARTIHEQSGRAGKPFIAVNCSAIPESLLEAELFGYERGAFTGAVNSRDGRFALADKGTLFLDEVGETSPAVQVKLLRVLQEGEFEKLGGRTVKVDIRLVAATNKDLPHEVREGRFREDLFYRLNVIPLQVPTLRERPDDIPLLADYFLRRYAQKNSKLISGYTRQALERLTSYHWPGNVRELENLVERAVVLTKGQVIDVEDLPAALVEEAPVDRATITVSVGTPLEEVERVLIYETLKRTKGDKRLAAQLLGIATRTIYRKLESSDVDPGE